MIQPVNNSQPSFGKYAIVQVPHKAFKNTKNYIAIEDEFVRTCEKAVNMPSAWKCKIAEFFGKAICPKIDAYLESANYPELMESLNEIGGYSIDWAKLHTGANINPPRREGYHSFIILTGKEFDKMADVLFSNSKNIERDDFIKERIDNFKNSGKAISNLVVNAIVNELAIKEFDEVFGNVTPKTIEISSLSELPPIVESLME